MLENYSDFEYHLKMHNDIWGCQAIARDCFLILSQRYLNTSEMKACYCTIEWYIINTDMLLVFIYEDVV